LRTEGGKWAVKRGGNRGASQTTGNKFTVPKKMEEEVVARPLEKRWGKREGAFWLPGGWGRITF